MDVEDSLFVTAELDSSWIFVLCVLSINCLYVRAQSFTRSSVLYGKVMLVVKSKVRQKTL